MIKRFYVYVYFRVDGTPYYVGKGQGNRAFQRNRAGVKPPRDLNRVKVLVRDLSEVEAWEWETDLISLLGRIDLGTGCLRNRTDGGEGASGAVRTKEFREKVSLRTKGQTSKARGYVGITDGVQFRRIHPRHEIPEGWRRGYPDSLKEAISRGHHDVSGENNPAYGKRRITNGLQEKRIPMSDPIPEGWWEGGIPNKRSKIENKPVEIFLIGESLGVMFSSCKEASVFLDETPTRVKRVAIAGTTSRKGWRARFI